MASYEESVFINCPFDAEYQPLFRALVFAVHDCGFLARCALEVDDSGQPRIEQLYDLIGRSRLGIHDISRTELNENGLPRFNMPLELGIFLGATRFGIQRHREKASKVLDVDRYRFQEFISDIAGQDPAAHNGDPAKAIVIVRDWLQAQQRVKARIPSGTIIAERYRQFQYELPVVCQPYLDPDALTFIDFQHVVDIWLRENGFP